MIAALLLRELTLFPEWYIGKHLGLELTEKQTATLNKIFDLLLANNLAQPQVYVHRDYHSRNLMVLTEGNPGILDFQDAVFGPITYDLASLLRDAYVQWDEEIVLDWAIRYWERARRAGLPVNPDIDAFYRDFEFMGLQRHLKSTRHFCTSLSPRWQGWLSEGLAAGDGIHAQGRAALQGAGAVGEAARRAGRQGAASWLHVLAFD
jgi:aminoglycoside/choline kinase family phosphotransferase